MNATVTAAAIGVGGSVIVALAAFWANVRNTNKTTTLTLRALELTEQGVKLTEQGQVTERYTTEADLTFANLSTAKLAAADLNGTRLTGTNLTAAKLDPRVPGLDGLPFGAGRAAGGRRGECSGPGAVSSPGGNRPVLP